MCSCVSVGTDQGFKIFTVDPYKQCFSHRNIEFLLNFCYQQLLEGGMSCVQMLYTTSLLGLVGAGQQASLSPRRLQLFNTSESKVICELNFVTSILNVLMSKKRLVVVLERKVSLMVITTYNRSIYSILVI
jgi:autophagy-related protein 18